MEDQEKVEMIGMDQVTGEEREDFPFYFLVIASTPLTPHFPFSFTSINGLVPTNLVPSLITTGRRGAYYTLHGED